MAFQAAENALRVAKWCEGKAESVLTVLEVGAFAVSLYPESVLPPTASPAHTGRRPLQAEQNTGTLKAFPLGK